MAATTTICCNPSPKFLGGILFERKFLNRSLFPHALSASRSNFCGGFVLHRSLAGRNRPLLQNSMDELIRASAFGDDNSDERFQSLEQEALVDGLSQFGSKFALQQGLEPILNRLVRHYT